MGFFVKDVFVKSPWMDQLPILFNYGTKICFKLNKGSWKFVFVSILVGDV